MYLVEWEGSESETFFEKNNAERFIKSLIEDDGYSQHEITLWKCTRTTFESRVAITIKD